MEPNHILHESRYACRCAYSYLTDATYGNQRMLAPNEDKFILRETYPAKKGFHGKIGVHKRWSKSRGQNKKNQKIVFSTLRMVLLLLTGKELQNDWCQAHENTVRMTYRRPAGFTKTNGTAVYYPLSEHRYLLSQSYGSPLCSSCHKVCNLNFHWCLGE